MKVTLTDHTIDAVNKIGEMASICSDDIRLEWDSLLIQCEDLYHKAIKSGIKKEDARYILPGACTTQLNLCLNFQGWRDFLKNRTAKSAQWEIRDVALEIQRQLIGIAPEIFE